VAVGFGLVDCSLRVEQRFGGRVGPAALEDVRVFVEFTDPAQAPQKMRATQLDRGQVLVVLA